MRLRSNFQEGNLTNAPGSAGTTLQSAEFATLPVVASPDTLTLVLDPLAEGGAPEVVTVTAHTSASTSCTVTRAQDGTAARNLAAVGTRWIATPTRQDWTPDPPYLRLRKDNTQSLSSGTAASVTFSTVEKNLGGFDIVSTSLWSPPVDGIYAVDVMAAFQGPTAATVAHVTRRIVNIRNDTDATTLDPQASTPCIPASVDTNVILACEVELLASKDYALRARHDAVDATRDLQSNTNMTVRYVRPST